MYFCFCLSFIKKFGIKFFFGGFLVIVFWGNFWEGGCIDLIVFFGLVNVLLRCLWNFGLGSVFGGFGFDIFVLVLWMILFVEGVLGIFIGIGLSGELDDFFFFLSEEWEGWIEIWFVFDDVLDRIGFDGFGNNLVEMFVIFGFVFMLKKFILFFLLKKFFL